MNQEHNRELLDKRFLNILVVGDNECAGNLEIEVMNGLYTIVALYALTTEDTGNVDVSYEKLNYRFKNTGN